MILYIDCAAGVSGDMLLAGWVDLGLPLPALHRFLSGVGLSGVVVRAQRIRCQGGFATRLTLDSRRFSRRIPAQAQGILQWFRRTAASAAAREQMARALTRLAKAEGAVHGVAWRKVVFHQLARLDTWVWLAGFCAGLAHFRVRAVYVSPVPIGAWHQDSHGIWRRSPSPAVCRMLRRFATYYRQESFEWSTPTGAMLLSAFGSTRQPPRFKVRGIGQGVGHHPFKEGPAVLRMWWGSRSGA